MVCGREDGKRHEDERGAEEEDGVAHPEEIGIVEVLGVEKYKENNEEKTMHQMIDILSSERLSIEEAEVAEDSCQYDE